MTKQEAQKIFNDAKENVDRVNACELHDFNQLPSPLSGKAFFLQYRCRNCGSTIDRLCYHWYSKGFEHGKKQSKELKFDETN